MSPSPLIGPRLFLSNGSLLGLGMQEGRTNPRLSWGIWAIIATMALFFVSMKEVVWAFLAIWSTFAMAARNIPNIDVLPVQGINVYDILRRKTLVLTKAALDALEARFK